MRIIPGKTKIGIEIFKGINLTDFLIGLLFLALAVVAMTSSLAGKLYITAALILAGVALLIKIGDEPNYMFFLSVLRHLVYRKSYRKDGSKLTDIGNISSFKAIENGYIVYDGYYGAAIEIPPVEFRFFSSYRRSISIDECLGNVLRSMNVNYAANLVKIERKVPYDGYLENEHKKIRELRQSYECGLISEEEFQAKCEVVFDRITELENMNSAERTVAPYYYLVFFDSDKNQLKLQIDTALNTLERGEMKPKRLDSKDLALFLKYTNELDFDDSELETLSEEQYARWAMPRSLKIRSKDYHIDDITAYTMAVSNYPLQVGDAWLAGVMSIPSTKVVVKLQPMDKMRTIRNIDRSISELRTRYNHTNVDSTLIELGDHINSLSELLSLLQSDNEVLLNTDVYITCYDVPLTKKEGRDQAVENTNLATISNMRNVVRRLYRESDIRLTSLQFRQIEGYVGSQISGYDPLAKTFGRGIPGSTAAAMFPWIYAHVQDPLGIKLGSEDGIPVFIDMFRRDSERVNSNVVIVGKSGSGKSYAAKSILVNLAADNSKIFVLDPENEYAELADNLHGKFINVGNAQQGRMNPFHIITALEDDDAEGGVTGSYATHMQFLEEFFKQILPDCEKEALEYLNTVADRVYMHKGITSETNLSLLKPEDYPTFSDLYDEILKEFQYTDNEYLRGMLRTLMNYVSKFSSNGRNANIWNGPSTITTDENFTVFNFQSLLAGGNRTITNAQMLLVMKYIDNEIIKNREYNTKYGTNRKIVVVIDEAHVFIDDKYPIALDFMYQLAKRIRKYNGMQIVITQNIKDFVGSEDISRKSSAIINACQYSYIFSLAPNDMSDLCKLYEKAGGINENEQDKIVTAPRGNAFVILGPTTRSSFQVEVPEDVVQVFETRGLESRYFAGENGKAEWENFLGSSRDRHLENRTVRVLPPPAEDTDRPSSIKFIEISEEEYERQLAQQRENESEKVTFSEVTAPTAETAAGTQPENNDAYAASTEQEATNPAILPAPVIIREKVSDSGEMAQVVSELRRVVDSVQKFSYDAMLIEIMRRLGSTPGAMPVEAAAGAKAAGQNSIQRADRITDEADEEASGESGDSNDLFNMILANNSRANEEGKTEDSSESESDEMALADYLNELSIEEEATSDIGSDSDSDDAEDDSYGGFDMYGDKEEKFDIMAFIEKSAAELESVTVLEDMASGDERVRTITLEELVRLNKSRKSAK